MVTNSWVKSSSRTKSIAGRMRTAGQGGLFDKDKHCIPDLNNTSDWLNLIIKNPTMYDIKTQRLKQADVVESVTNSKCKHFYCLFK